MTTQTFLLKANVIFHFTYRASICVKLANSPSGKKVKAFEEKYL